MFRFTKNMKFFIKSRVSCTSRVFPGHVCRMRGPSLAELTWDRDSATLVASVQIRMSYSVLSINEYDNFEIP